MLFWFLFLLFLCYMHVYVSVLVRHEQVVGKEIEVLSKLCDRLQLN